MMACLRNVIYDQMHCSRPAGTRQIIYHGFHYVFVALLMVMQKGFEVISEGEMPLNRKSHIQWANISAVPYKNDAISYSNE